jgi:hypothetical protein
MGDRDRINALLDEMILLQNKVAWLEKYAQQLEELLGARILNKPED